MTDTYKKTVHVCALCLVEVMLIYKTLHAEEVSKGAVAPANTPAEPRGRGVQGGPSTSYQLMLAHIVGGQYRSPTLGQQDAANTPPTVKHCNYTPYLLATPAGKLPAELSCERLMACITSFQW